MNEIPLVTTETTEDLPKYTYNPTESRIFTPLSLKCTFLMHAQPLQIHQGAACGECPRKTSQTLAKAYVLGFYIPLSDPENALPCDLLLKQHSRLRRTESISPPVLTWLSPLRTVPTSVVSTTVSRSRTYSSPLYRDVVQYGAIGSRASHLSCEKGSDYRKNVVRQERFTTRELSASCPRQGELCQLSPALYRRRGCREINYIGRRRSR